MHAALTRTALIDTLIGVPRGKKSGSWSESDDDVTIRLEDAPYKEKDVSELTTEVVSLQSLESFGRASAGPRLAGVEESGRHSTTVQSAGTDKKSGVGLTLSSPCYGYGCKNARFGSLAGTSSTRTGDGDRAAARRS